MFEDRKELFDTYWNSMWFFDYGMKGGTLDYSSNDIQSLHRLVYMAIDGMEDALTMPGKDS